MDGLFGFVPPGSAGGPDTVSGFSTVRLMRIRKLAFGFLGLLPGRLSRSGGVFFGCRTESVRRVLDYVSRVLVHFIIRLP